MEQEDNVSSSYFSTPRTLRLAAVAKLILNHLETELSEQQSSITISIEQIHNGEEPSNTKLRSSVSDIISIKCPMIKRDAEILCLVLLIPDWNNITAISNSRNKCIPACTICSTAMSKDVLKDINKALGNAVHLDPDTVFSLPLQLLAEVCLRSYAFTKSLVSETLKHQSKAATKTGGGGMHDVDDHQLNTSRVVKMHGIADMLGHSTSTRAFIQLGIADIK